MTNKEREIVRLIDQALQVCKVNIETDDWLPGDSAEREWGRVDILHLMRSTIKYGELSSLALRGQHIREDV